MKQYTVIFCNNSGHNWYFCLYQQDPGLTTTPGVMSLAWFAELVSSNGGTNACQWATDYAFVWSETGDVVNGAARFNPAQTVPADLALANQIVYGANGFTPASQGSPAGSLTIIEDSSVQAKPTYIGIGMSDSATFAVPSATSPSVQFTPNPQYWCTYGLYATGQVMNIQEIEASIHIQFSGNQTQATVTLSPELSLSIAYN